MRWADTREATDASNANRGRPAPLAAAGAQTEPRDAAFIALLNAYRSHGGLDGLHDSLRGAQAVPLAHEAAIRTLLGSGRLFGFHWHHALWIPRFQFAGAGPDLSVAPGRVLAALGPSLDGWAVAQWFVQAHPGLSGGRPIDGLGSCLPEILRVARSRAVAAGADSRPG